MAASPQPDLNLNLKPENKATELGLTGPFTLCMCVIPKDRLYSGTLRKFDLLVRGSET